jgi:1-hydroxycarotenoid 3,4-desaturase
VQSRSNVVVVGGGVGGLACAIDVALRGWPVTVLERAEQVGGKVRTERVGGLDVDVGPTVLTMPWVFDELFERAGACFRDEVRLVRAEVLARHAWRTPRAEPLVLDLFSDVERTVDAIGGAFGAREAEGYRRFAAHTARIFDTVDEHFLRAERPTMATIFRKVGAIGPVALARIDGHRTLWRALSDFFRDPRLLQLFGRYATYSGSSPFEAPGTLAVIAHVERLGVHVVEGGMIQLAHALRRLAERVGVTIRTGAHVARILVDQGGARGVLLEDGELVEARSVVLNGAVDALARGLFGEAARRGAPEPGARSLSALTFAMRARTSGLTPAHHTVFFGDSYPDEFSDLLARERLPRDPTVYLCASDRTTEGRSRLPPATPERLFLLVNAPPVGDRPDGLALAPEEVEACLQRTFDSLEQRGLSVERTSELVTTTPSDFERRFPATGGALYGQSSHGMTSPLARPGARSKIPGLYFAGGTVHPGAGVPMAATSGRLAASAVHEDLASTSRSRAGGMLGGMWTR